MSLHHEHGRIYPFGGPHSGPCSLGLSRRTAVGNHTMDSLRSGGKGGDTVCTGRP